MNDRNAPLEEDVKKFSYEELQKFFKEYEDPSGLWSAGGFWYQYVYYLITLFTYPLTPLTRVCYEYIDDISIYEDGKNFLAFSIQTKTYSLAPGSQVEVYRNWIQCPLAQNYVLVTGKPSNRPTTSIMSDSVVQLIHKEAFENGQFKEESKTKSAEIVRAAKNHSQKLEEYVKDRLEAIHPRVEYISIPPEKAPELAMRSYYRHFSGHLDDDADIPYVWQKRYQEIDRRLMQAVYTHVLVHRQPFVFTLSELNKLQEKVSRLFDENGPYAKPFDESGHADSAAALLEKSPKHVRDLGVIFGSNESAVARYVMYEFYYKEVREFITMRETTESILELSRLEKRLYQDYEFYYLGEPMTKAAFHKLVHENQTTTHLFNDSTRNEGIPGCFIFLSDLDEENYAGGHIAWQ